MCSNKKVKHAIGLHGYRQGAHLPSLGHEPISEYTTKCVAHGQYDARPAVTFPAAEHNRPVANTNYTA